MPVISARLSTHSFAESWLHCQLLADFTARFASSDRFDAERHASMLSSLVNELVELVFRKHAPARELKLQVFKAADELLVRVTVPADAALRAEYAALFEQVSAAAADEHLRENIRREPGAATSVRSSLIELARIYELKLEARELDHADSIVITMPVQLG